MTRILGIGLAVALFAAGLAATSSNGFAQGVLPDQANMKILQVRTRLMHLQDNVLGDDIPSDLDQLMEFGVLPGRVGCGSVEIGNQIAGVAPSGDITIIIAGDIINAGNKCQE